MASFERALKLNPRYVEAENNLGLSCLALNRSDEAKKAFQEAIDWQGTIPSDAQPFLNLGTLIADMGNLEDAVPYLTKAAALAPRNPRIHEKLGQVYQAQKNLAKAQSELEQAIALAPDVSALHYNLGEVYQREGFSDKAQYEFGLCERLNSTHSSKATPNP